MKTTRDIWNNRYRAAGGRSTRASDDWLAGWRAYLSGSNGHALDLGCGWGWDCQFLLDCGFKVTAVDFSSEAIAHCEEAYPGVNFSVMDFRDGIDFPEAAFEVVVASLSLHYFGKEETHRIFFDVGRILKRGGLFMFRVNAEGDYNSGYKPRGNEWETISVDGVSKQFFNKSMLERLLANDFKIRKLEFSETDRYGRTKKTINCVAQRI